MTDTEAILQATLDVVRRDGWKPNGWGVIPPWCIRRALGRVIEQEIRPLERDAANAAARQAISNAIGEPLGAIMSWEAEKGRTQQDVLDVLEKAIAGLP